METGSLKSPDVTRAQIGNREPVENKKRVPDHSLYTVQHCFLKFKSLKKSSDEFPRSSVKKTCQGFIPWQVFILFDKGSVTQFFQGLLNFFDRIHHERPIRHDWLLERRSGNQHKPHRLIFGLDRDAVAI